MVRIYFLILLSLFSIRTLCLTSVPPESLEELRLRVRRMFQHAYDGYMRHAFPLDELQPLTCDGRDTWGSFSLTLVDSLDTLVVMGNHSEFARAVDRLLPRLDVNKNVNVSVFETNIRVVGGLVSAHLLSHRTGVVLEEGWPCSGPLLRAAERFARKLLPAFDTPTGMPYGTVNLRDGVPRGETTITCTAGVATFILEFGALSRLTGDPIFEQKAMQALRALWKFRSASTGLVGNHIDVATGKWSAQEAGIGAGVDSYFEYLAKGAMIFRLPELHHMFKEYKRAIDTYVRHDDWHFWVHMDKHAVTMPIFQSLEAYWPGVLALTGHVDDALKTLHNYHQLWKQFGSTPEFFNVPKGLPVINRKAYPLRPELIESIVYVYRATGDPVVFQMGVDILAAIERVARTDCGFATVADVTTHRLENRMESFFLAETTKYLYLLFDPDNFLHQLGHTSGRTIDTPGGQCLVDTGGYVFNTEAHPIDAATLYCCSPEKKRDDLVLLELYSNADLVQLLNLSVPDPLVRELTAEEAAGPFDQQTLRSAAEGASAQLPYASNATDLTCGYPEFHRRFALYGEMILTDEKDRQ